MFWRFGFHNTSSIDALLDKEDVVLEAILDEDDLLQECKSQNTRLIDYFQRVDILQRLLAYVAGQIEDEDRGRFKYPYVATEVLCSEIWSIVETCINNQNTLLVPFWETVLDRPPEDMKTQMVMASHFAKINAIFLNKKPAEMLAFIQSQPSVVERLLRHIETPSIVDLLVRIIQLDEHPGGSGVLEWLSSENLMGRLIELLSPSHTGDIHTVVAELIKGIISMATPSPGAGLTEGLQNGPASNRFARELAHPKSISKLVDYMLCDFGKEDDDAMTCTLRDSYGDEDFSEQGYTDELPHPNLPDIHSASSSVVHSISVVVELIRKNNSDYFEPYLFHTLRNRLIQVQQQLQSDDRETLERAMREMVDRMGVVHLGSVLEIMCDRLETFQQYLRTPRSLNGTVFTTIGPIIPLTFERYRICELLAELLHCSNMSLLNRSAEFNNLYDSEGRLQGGLSALEELAQVISVGSGDDGGNEKMDQCVDETEPALELPIATGGSRDSPSLLDLDDDMSDGDEPGSSDEDVMDEITMSEEPTPNVLPSPPVDKQLQQHPIIAPSAPDIASSPSQAELGAQGAALNRRTSSLNYDSDNSTTGPRSHSSRRNSKRSNAVDNSADNPMPIGEKLKRRFLDMNVLSTLLDLFFEFPWNNFLHSAVYDLIHQILTGRVDTGLNRELTIALFRDARLMHRIVEGQNANDIECAKPKGVRLGYMGHLTLISEDVIGALDHFPTDLRFAVAKYIPEAAWEEYVTGRYNETKKKDCSLLGGGKPVLVPSGARATGRWRVDEEEPTSPTTASVMSEINSGTNGVHAMRGEFRRAISSRPSRESSADFGRAVNEEDDEAENDTGSPQFAHYLVGSSDNFGSSGSDDDDDDGGWLSHSTFGLGSPPVSARRSGLQRRPLATNGFDDVFNPDDVSNVVDPFNADGDDDEITFEPFSDSDTAGSDPFSFSTSFSEEMENGSFDSFGDFGDFQSAQDGELTPTTGSWSFTSSSTASDDAGSEGSGHAEDAFHPHGLENENQMPP